MPELLHPRMSDVYREKVRSLCLALGAEDSRMGAADAIRALVDAIVLEPDGERLNITLKGDLAGMLSAARDSKGRQIPATSLGPNKAGCGGTI
jgi:site-specific DNA recombinase